MHDAPRLHRLNRIGFLAWSWAMLLVVLVSAAPDGGAPGSRLVGSAFDPATPAVGLTVQRPSEVATVATTDDGQPFAPHSGSGGLLAALPAALSAHDFSAALPLRFAHSRGGGGGPRAWTRAHGARAPPFA